MKCWAKVIYPRPRSRNFKSQLLIKDTEVQPQFKAHYGFEMAIWMLCVELLLARIAWLYVSRSGLVATHHHAFFRNCLISCMFQLNHVVDRKLSNTVTFHSGNGSVQLTADQPGR